MACWVACFAVAHAQEWIAHEKGPTGAAPALAGQSASELACHLRPQVLNYIGEVGHLDVAQLAYSVERQAQQLNAQLEAEGVIADPVAFAADAERTAAALFVGGGTTDSVCAYLMIAQQSRYHQQRLLQARSDGARERARSELRSIFRWATSAREHALAKPLNPYVPQADAAHVSAPERLAETSAVSVASELTFAAAYTLEEQARTASGEIFAPGEFTAAHASLPMNSMLRITNLENGREVNVRVNDRRSPGRDVRLSLSPAAAAALGIDGPAHVQIRIELLAR